MIIVLERIIILLVVHHGSIQSFILPPLLLVADLLDLDRTVIHFLQLI